LYLGWILGILLINLLSHFSTVAQVSLHQLPNLVIIISIWQ
jgi:hypothetical protein